MKIREHRGGYADSMSTLAEIPRTMEALAQHVGVDASRIQVKHYGGIDPDWWDSYMVLVDGKPWGYTDKCLLEDFIRIDGKPWRDTNGPEKKEPASPPFNQVIFEIDSEDIALGFRLDAEEAEHWRALLAIRKTREERALRNAARVLGSEEGARRAFVIFKAATEVPAVLRELLLIEKD